MTPRAGLQVAEDLAAFLEDEALPGTGIRAGAFWSGFAGLLAEFAPQNRALLARRDAVQAEIDAWHIARRGQPHDHAAYKAFLAEIGYLLPEGPDFQIETTNVDPEVARVAGPQLVVPVTNARYALNAANARWGSLYDAYYGTDALDAANLIMPLVFFISPTDPRMIGTINRTMAELVQHIINGTAAGTIYDALTSDTPAAIDDFILESSVNGLFLVPSDRQLTGAEIELVSLADRERRARDLLRPARDRFDFIFIDTPPSLGLLTLNALVAADSVLIPLHCEYFALEGLADLVATLRRVRSAFNPDLDIEGVLLTMHDERTNLGQQVARDIRAFFQERVYSTVIPRNIRLAEAPSHGKPVIAYDMQSKGAQAYLALAGEMLRREQEAAAA